MAARTSTAKNLGLDSGGFAMGWMPSMMCKTPDGRWGFRPAAWAAVEVTASLAREYGYAEGHVDHEGRYEQLGPAVVVGEQPHQLCLLEQRSIMM